jgi:hypothetical protein
MNLATDNGAALLYFPNLLFCPSKQFLRHTLKNPLVYGQTFKTKTYVQ